MRHLFIGMPLRDRNIDVFTAGVLLNAQKECGDRGWKFSVDFSMGTHAVHHARNMLVKTFLSLEDCTDMLLLDADVAAPSGSITRLMDHPVDFVCAFYRMKFDPPTYSVTAPDGGNEFEMDEDLGLIKVGGAGVGFCRVSRNVIQTMMDDLRVNHPDSWYYDRNPDVRYWPVFSFGQDGHSSIGEDVFFFKRWQALGGTCYCDPYIRTCHIGPKAYQGVFSEGLQTSENGGFGFPTIDPAMIRNHQAAL